MQTFSRDALAESERAALEVAAEAARRAYAPYSGFAVGAALVTEGEDIVAGCNVENASYGLTVCAERVALSAAVAAGQRYFLLLAVWTPTPAPLMPCGSCRQVLVEFNPRLRLVLGCEGDEVVVVALDELIPNPFRGTRGAGGASD